MTSKELTITSVGEDLAAYIDSIPTAFHGARESAARLEAAGASRLYEDETWSLEANRLYYLMRDGSAVIAFSTAGLDPGSTGVNVTGAHLDSPLLKLKGNQLQEANGILTAGIEVYGGPIYATWLDRDLALAGRYVISEGEGLTERLFLLKNLKAMIPNVAIHMNREINKELKYNPQTEFRALLFHGADERETDIRHFIAAEEGIQAESILDMECFLVPEEKASVFTGAGASAIIRSGRIDNLAGCHGILQGFLASEPEKHRVPGFVCLYNSEEIGSRTRSGAASRFFDQVLERFFIAAGLSPEQALIARQKSYQISVDGAHALHPNYADKHDALYRPRLNHGIVLKRSAGYKYGTDAVVASRLLSLAHRHQIRVQDMVNRADVPSGSTIGTISMTLLDIPTVDIGIGMLAMHSSRETAGIGDQLDMIRLMEAFFMESVPLLNRV
jgi:aspartyl aminopeptidase